MKRFLMLLPVLSVSFLACGTPRPTDAAFPSQIGSFTRKDQPSPVENNGLYATYVSPGGISVTYTVLRFRSPDEARAGLQKERQEAATGAKVSQQSESKFIVVYPNRASMVGLVEGSTVVLVATSGQATDDVIGEFVKNLPKAAYGTRN